MAVHRRWLDGTPDPVFFLGYWGNDEATRDEVHRRLVPHRRPGARPTTTATSGTRAAPTTCSRASGYRVGPAEIENCLVKHAAVANCAVVPSPDETRGAVIKAFVLLAPGHAPSETLKDSIREHVKRHLAPYQQPREIEFVAELPMTTTGKVQRKVLRDREAAKATSSDPPTA